MATYNSVRRAFERRVAAVSEKTGVTKELVGKVIAYAKRLSRPDDCNNIDENTFVAQLHQRFGLTNSLMIHLTFDLFKNKANGTMTVDDYVNLICTYISPKIDLQVELVFNVYDVDHNRKLDKPELNTFIGHSTFAFVNEDQEMEIKDLRDIIINTCDQDGDRCVDFREFRDIVKKNVLFLEMLGQVLPKQQHKTQFIELLEGMDIPEVRTYFEQERVRSLSLCSSLQEKRDDYFPIDLDVV